MKKFALCASLDAWSTIERDQKQAHGMTYPLALVSAILQEAGYDAPICWEGEHRPEERASDVRYLLISAMDPRHMWGIGPWLQSVGCPLYSKDRTESDPIVIMGGHAAHAPATVEHLVDVIFIGHAEAGLLPLLEILDGPGTRRERLDRAAALPGVLVPSHFPAGHTVAASYAQDIGISLRSDPYDMSVNHRTIYRLEIARGCPSKCGFCVLGWRAPYKENPLSEIKAALLRAHAHGIREIHLSGGDAEQHSQINEIRAFAVSLGMRDQGWTGRLDSVNDCSISAGKQFAFGLEGMSHRLRKIAGKPKLSDDYIVDRCAGFWQLGGRRMMFHLIGNLPGETDFDAEQFTALMRRLESEASRIGERIFIEIGRQPFGPLPHTPMQWFAPGLSHERVGRSYAQWIKHPILSVTDKYGQSYKDALLNTLVIRGGPEVRHLVERGVPRLASPFFPSFLNLCQRNRLSPSRYLAPLSPGDPLPWDHIRTHYSPESLHAAYTRLLRMVLDV